MSGLVWAWAALLIGCSLLPWVFLGRRMGLLLAGLALGLGVYLLGSMWLAQVATGQGSGPWEQWVVLICLFLITSSPGLMVRLARKS